MATPITSVRVGSLTDIGELRDHNEDDLCVLPQVGRNTQAASGTRFTLGQAGCLLVVADGMGGATSGEVASQQAVMAIRDYFTATDQADFSDSTRVEHLERSIFYAQVKLINLIKQQPHFKGMGTTVAIAWVVDDRAYVGWVGDSRCYLMEASGRFRLLTNDHSVVWQLVMAGKLTPEEANQHDERNIITQSLGSADHPPCPEFITVPLQQGDRLLLCSDGLNSMLTDKAIAGILRQWPNSEHTCQQLVKAANEAGGEDNITVVMLDVLEAAQATRNTADALPPIQDPARTRVWNFIKNIRL
ncbi:PP2C family protein-serine/threonine phosphatase [Spirosoma panaciterrae]|uniref:PP2C family protein-serine/threonine phosphatase n=1 Tax=Spirosoma panaciterrae TaxID=496058 RepID=UPI00037FB360|nr:protein phosphatase 2C domain-containing protein [Spirosoma panaciterrae]